MKHWQWKGNRTFDQVVGTKSMVSWDIRRHRGKISIRRHQKHIRRTSFWRFQCHKAARTSVWRENWRWRLKSRFPLLCADISQLLLTPRSSRHQHGLSHPPNWKSMWLASRITINYTRSTVVCWLDEQSTNKLPRGCVLANRHRRKVCRLTMMLTDKPNTKQTLNQCDFLSRIL